MNGVPPIMNDSAGQAKAMVSLRSLLERLGSPELTLPEAKFLRSQISQVRRNQPGPGSFGGLLLARCSSSCRHVAGLACNAADDGIRY